MVAIVVLDDQIKDKTPATPDVLELYWLEVCPSCAHRLGKAVDVLHAANVLLFNKTLKIHPDGKVEHVALWGVGPLVNEDQIVIPLKIGHVCLENLLLALAFSIVQGQV